MTTNLDFLKSCTGKPSYVMQEHGMPPIASGQYWQREVCIYDGRNLQEDIRLDTHGFELIRQPTAFQEFDSETKIAKAYLPEVIELIRRHLNAKWVEAIDYTIRTSASGVQQRGPAPRVHNDYTEASAMEKFCVGLGAEFSDITKQKRLVQINLWRPITEPVLVAPLAIADGRSILFEDLVPCDVIYPDRVGENYELKYNPNQRWIYFSHMMHEEAIMIKGFDSAKDGRVRFAPHSAFNHPYTSPSDPDRWSIEVRTLVII